MHKHNTREVELCAEKCRGKVRNVAGRHTSGGSQVDVGYAGAGGRAYLNVGTAGTMAPG